MICGLQRVATRVPMPNPVRTGARCIAGLRLNDITTPIVLDGPRAKEAWLVDVRQRLCPALHPGDLVIADNLGSHTNGAGRKAVEAVGATLLYLPPYSPDFHPIAMGFSKRNALLKKAAHRTVDARWHALGTLLDPFSPGECRNYFKAAGYRA